MTSETIYPTKHLVQVFISITDYPDFKKIWSNQKTLDFYCMEKNVVGDHVILSIRAMRINEFIQILNDYNIKWLKE